MTIEFWEHTMDTLNEPAKNSGDPLNVALERAIESYRRQSFFEGLSADVDRLRKDPEAWKEELDERAAWDVTLDDGLDDNMIRDRLLIR